MADHNQRGPDSVTYKLMARYLFVYGYEDGLDEGNKTLYVQICMLLGKSICNTRNHELTRFP
jgi:hypothetical protein